MNAKNIAIFGLALGLLAGGTVQAAAPLRVAAGIPPIAGLVERIGGKHVAVEVLASAGQCMHDMALSPKQMVEVGKSQVFLSTGMPFESRLLEKMTEIYPRLVVVDVTQGITRRRLEEACKHGDDEATGHACGETDPHVWLSPANVKVILGNIATAIEKADPISGPDYRLELGKQSKQADQVAARLRKALEPLGGRTIWVYHPTLGYLADEFGLKQKAVEAGGKAPSTRELRELIRQARSEGVKAIFVEPHSDQRGVSAIAEAVGCKVVTIDPMSKDVLENLDAMAGKIEAALGDDAKK